MQKAPTNLLTETGLKKTNSRIAVLNILAGQKQPVDVSQIISFLRENRHETNTVTVYRMLDLFYKKGLVERLELQEGKFRYELTSSNHHHHLVCEKCGKIEDVEDKPIQKLEKEIASRSKFKIKYHSLEFFGLCQTCQKEN